MRKLSKLKLQAIAVSLALLVSYIGEPVSLAHASETVALKNVIDEDEAYDTKFMVFTDVINNDIVLEAVLEKPVVEEVIEEPEVVVEEIIEEPVVEVVEEPKVEVKEEKPKEEVKSEPVEANLSDIDLIALVVMAEAEGEPVEGKRLVIDVILNRVDSGSFPNSISGVVYQKGQFEAMWNGRVDRCEVRDDIRQLVEEEMASRTNSKVLYFRTNHYHNFGTPELNVGNHYFSS